MNRITQPHNGFTLIELMITLAVAALLIVVGTPALTDFVAAQRVRATTSDLVGDMALARAEAIKESRPALLERLAGATSTWKDGWRICVDLDGDNTCDANEIRKQTGPIPGRTQVCSTTTDFDDRVVFRPDGRVVRVLAPAANDGLRVSDNNGDAATANDRIRLIFVGVSGRARMEIQDNDPANPTRGTACP